MTTGVKTGADQYSLALRKDVMVTTLLLKFQYFSVTDLNFINKRMAPYRWMQRELQSIGTCMRIDAQKRFRLSLNTGNGT